MKYVMVHVEEVHSEVYRVPVPDDVENPVDYVDGLALEEIMTSDNLWEDHGGDTAVIDMYEKKFEEDE